MRYLSLSSSLATFAVVGVGLAPVQAAQISIPSPDQGLSSASTLISNVSFPEAPDRGTLKSGTVGGGSRSGNEACIQEPFLIPLTPADRVGTTLAANPTLMWFMPKTSVDNGELVVWDAEGNYIYSQEFSLPQEPGLVTLTIPTPLELNTSYWWEMAVICDNSDRSNDAYVWGYVQRYNLDSLPREEAQFGAQRLDAPTKTRLLSQLQTLQSQEPGLMEKVWKNPRSLSDRQVANAVEQAEVYAQLYLWHECLSLLTPIRDRAPEAWSGLLQSIGIEADSVVEAKIVKNLNDLNQQDPFSNGDRFLGNP